MRNLIYIALLFLAACGGKKDDSSSDNGTSPDVTAQMPELRLIAPESGARVLNSVNISVQCTTGVVIQVSGDTTPDSLSCANGTMTKTFEVSGAEGVKGILMRQENSAGFSNLSISLFKDLTAPGCSYLSSFAFTRTLPFEIEFSCADNDRIRTIQCSLDGSAFSACTNGSYQITGLSEGTHLFQIKGFDEASNESSLFSKSFVHDSVAPVISVASSPPLLTSATTAHVEFSIVELGSLIAMTDCQLDGAAWAPCGSPIDLSGLSGGDHELKVRSTDHAGNVGLAQINWQIDLIPPNGYTIAGVSGGTDVLSDAYLSAGNEAWISWSDSVGEENYYLSILSSDGSMVVCPEVILGVNTTHHGFAGCLLNSGSQYKVKLYASDSFSNIGSVQFFNFLVTGWNDLVFSVASSDYGALNPGQVLERAFTLTYSGDVPIQSLTGSLLGSGFVFKGGSFPGVGGTCANGTVGDCTIVLNYAPTSVGAHSGTVQVSFSNGFEVKTRSLSLTGEATLPSPSKLAFVAPAGVASGDCALVQLISQTTEGIASAVSLNTTVTLVVNNGSGAFYSSPACTTTATSAVILSGASDGTVYFKSTTANQNLTLVATASGLSGATHYVNVGAAPSALLISGVNQGLVDTCLALTADRIDSYGYKIGSIVSQSINLSATGSLEIFSDSECTNSEAAFSIPANQTGVSFYAKNNVVESAIITVTGSGLASDTHVFSSQMTLSWWNSAWSKRIRVNISNLDQAESFTNVPVLLRLSASNIQYGSIQPQGQDVRLIAADDSTVLSHEIEVWNPSGESLVWVKIPNIAASSPDGFVYLYFGNALALDGQNKNQVWTSYSAVWHLQESPTISAPQFQNAVGVNYNGTAENSPISASAIIGNGLNLNGNFDGFDVGSNLASVIGYSSTMSLWMKSTQVGNNTNWLAPGITGVEQAGGTNDIFFGWMDAGGKIAITAGDAAAAKSNFVVNDNNWRHVSMSRDHLSGTSKFYVNGVFNASANTGVGAKTTPFQKIGIIGDTGGSPTEFDGFVDEIRLYNSVQTDGRIKADFKYQNGTHVSYSLIEARPN